ncbi:hypothetical protein [Thermostichus sp. MS-CIW-25]|jgi:uncharacterized protein YoxC
MTTPTEDRLDRIERVVEVLVNQQREVLGRVDGLSHRVDSLTEQVDNLTDRVDNLTNRVDSLTDRVDNLSQSVSKLSADVDKLGFKFDTAQSVGERPERLATSLIAGATISIIAGVILVLLREGSR